MMNAPIVFEMLPDSRPAPRWRHTYADHVAMVVGKRSGTQYGYAIIKHPYWQMYSIFCDDADVRDSQWIAVQELLLTVIEQGRKKHPDLLPLMGSIETPKWVQFYRELAPDDDDKDRAYGLYQYNLGGKTRFFRDQDEDELTQLWYIAPGIDFGWSFN
ncbi:uncharacterized protein BO72DRAFT_520398 [Aspergillus fijiensis CBS 313.89]|uniref:Uncharacterized protein n=1 Tax=Aspergillus fijiensis CBS 313.89 TaxID=1448319 RepID=A0A8G1RH06_9EURO|nr:uncharacterized protein BO72DRAFT_520398 [Aspergillus fijiensis CBS 313.89]RAK72689.1 hypothetical protein BO72DRAFT_520398 [Aspergillus fijiensis CBS 313.89]